MKSHKIKNMSKTGAKVLLFSILAVTLGFVSACRSGGNDDNKGDGMKPGDNMTDADAVKRAKNALRIDYAEGDSAESVTQDVRLPTAGENGVAIAWESGNSAVIAIPPPPPDSEPITGTVNRPDDANTEVTLTATLTKNDARDERRFTLTVIISEDGTAVQRAKSALMIGYAAGDSRTSVTQNVSLPTGGANGVSVSWESSDAARISTTGTVTRPSAANTEVILTATLTKNDASDTRTFTLTVVPPCTTSEMTAKLKAMPPSLSGCFAVSIRGADMPALRSAGVTSAQFLAVWSADADMGFTPAQLWEASVTIAEMRSHGLSIAQMYNMGQGIPGYTLFNEACNTPQAVGTAPSPTITLTTTTLTAMDMQVVLRGVSVGSATWRFQGATTSLDVTNTNSQTIGSATARFVRFEGANIVSTLSIPLTDVFSNSTVTITDRSARDTSIQLCPGS